jgi:hypothetical protein
MNASERAAATIWDWRADEGARERHAAKLRQRGLLQGAVGLSIAAALFFLLHWVVIPAIAAGIAVFTVVAALASPTGLYARVAGLLEAFGLMVGTAVTWLVLTPVFFLVFAPFGLLTRRGSNDPMKRGYDKSASTYWITREPDADRRASRLRQF